MTRCIAVISFFVLLASLHEVHAAAYDDFRSLSPILDSAEHFFISLKNREFSYVWEALSENSSDTIISDVYKASSSINENTSKEDIVTDFNRRGMIFTNYWDSFRRSFDADMILEDSQWEMGPVTKESAEIIITHQRAHSPTTLTMRKEDNLWKIGLVETFWQRKAVRLLPLIFR